MTPPIALSCGEPAGIGPEIAARAWAELRGDLPFVYIGDARHLPAGTAHARIDDPSEAAVVARHALPVMQHDFPSPRRPGRIDPANAQAVIDVITRGVGLVQSGAARALCTAPINKQALKEGAGFAYPGHTEFLAALAGVETVVMMLACEALRVVPATIHIPLREVPAALDAQDLRETIRMTHSALQRDFGIENPRIAVAGLNPHAGEGGTMGDEEINLVTPVLDALRAEGMTILGPLPADTMFHQQARARYDAAVAMYHDQALIPIKTLDFARGVNVTLGLPFVRTSPDHGTALDIAGRGDADARSLIEALKIARRMASARQGNRAEPGR